jgi:F0F1-type ATP synthase assembly protein I
MAVALLMFLPGVAGQWLDEYLGTRFLSLIGFALGLVAGVWVLLVMTKTARPAKSRGARTEDKGHRK